MGDVSMIESIAVKYAPVVYFSPIEEYTLADPMSVFEGDGKIVSSTGTQDTLDLSTLADIGATDQYIDKTPLSEEYLAGAGYDENGQSMAPVYFTYADLGDNVWVLNYYYFFAYVGKITMGYQDPAAGYSQFQVAPFGQHDGDWQTISVVICASSEAEPVASPLAVQYYGLAQSQITDCGQDECTFYADTTTHVVAFSALGTHSMYSYPSIGSMIGSVDLASFQLGALYVMDVTQYTSEDGSEYVFVPTAENVKWADPSMDVWMYGGRWGVCADIDISPDLNLICTNKDGNEYAECPGAVESVLQLLSLFDTIDASVLPPGTINEALLPIIFKAALGDYGPYSSANSGTWTPPITSAIYSVVDPGTTSADACGDAGITAYLDESVPVLPPTPAPVTAPVRPQPSTSGASLQAMSLMGLFASFMVILVQ